ncbi:MAG: hypothetical protein J0I28_01305 [Caulobacterales bacterium]|nr:hypothetical protein [Caulobacterales bacterium]
MEFLKDRRIVLALGGALALLAGLVIAVAVMAGGKKKSAEAPPASQAGLVVEMGRDDDAKLDPARPLRCFVNGQFVGEITLADCARKNGVATGALDVGVDESGALAAADTAGTVLTPLPPEPVSTLATAPAPVTVTSGPSDACWRYTGGQWSRLPSDMPVSACVQTLFSGRCERTGGATYGRWGEETLRLVPGRVEISADNRSFRPLVDQGPAPGCAFP